MDLATTPSQQGTSTTAYLETHRLKTGRKLLQSTYPMDGKSIKSLLTSNSQEDVSTVNVFRWAALLEMYSGSSNIGTRYKGMKGYFNNHMYPNTYQAVRVINGPEGWASEANLLYVEWCTGEQELYNMTVDPHQVNNMMSAADDASLVEPGGILPLLHELSKLLAVLGDCKGPECYELPVGGDHDHDSAMEEEEDDDDDAHDVSATKQDPTLESMQSAIRSRIPCHNPVNTTSSDSRYAVNLRRKPFAYDLPIPEPFEFGFPFSDGDDIGEQLSEIWNEYEHYFY